MASTSLQTHERLASGKTQGEYTILEKRSSPHPIINPNHKSVRQGTGFELVSGVIGQILVVLENKSAVISQKEDTSLKRFCAVSPPHTSLIL